MPGVNPHVYVGVKMFTDKLTNLELAAIGNVALTGTNPKGVMGYDKVAPLFTAFGGTKMHSDALDALVAIIDERLAGHSREAS